MQYVISVMSNDHPGIVAGVSAAVEGLGGNITSCSQTVLGGYFTFITIIDLPKRYPPEELAGLIGKSRQLGPPCQVIAHYCEPGEISKADRNAGETFVITAFGKDRPGIVSEFSRYLAGHDVNITDLYGEKKGEEFMLVGQLTIPSTVNITHLREDLEETGKEFGFTIRLQHNNIFIATNQLRLAE